MTMLSDDLKAARRLIDTPNKWTQGWYQGDHGDLCALGAVNKAVSGEPRGFFPDAIRGRTEACRLALEAELPRYWKLGDGVAAFNDSRRRKHSDVVALFDRAIAAAEHQEQGK